MTSEALQNPYFVRLHVYYKNIDKTHSLTEPNDKIQYHGNYFFKKGGGGNHFGKGGGNRPPVPPPKSALADARFLVLVYQPAAKILPIGTSHGGKFPLYLFQSPMFLVSENV